MQSLHMKTSQPKKPRKVCPFTINHTELTSWLKLGKKMAWMKEKRNVVNRVNQAVNWVIRIREFFFWSAKY